MALFTNGVATAANQPAEDFQIDGRFLVEDVRLQGLQRVSAGTVFNLIPVTVGDALDSLAIRSTMRSLFRSGLFRRHSVGAGRWRINRNASRAAGD